jgi:hypothetical protein
MSDYSVSQFSARDSAGPVTCASCGCRLDGLSGALDGTYRHYASMIPGQDARGCKPACVDALHDHAGLPIVEAAAA